MDSIRDRYSEEIQKKVFKGSSHAASTRRAKFKLRRSERHLGVLPLRRPHVGALHVVLVSSRPDCLGSDLIQIEEHLRTGSIVCGNFGGAPLTAIQTRKKLAALTAISSTPNGTDAGASTAHIFAGKQLEVRSVICSSGL